MPVFFKGLGGKHPRKSIKQYLICVIDVKDIKHALSIAQTDIADLAETLRTYWLVDVVLRAESGFRFSKTFKRHCRYVQIEVGYRRISQSNRRMVMVALCEPRVEPRVEPPTFDF
jgi:hypothetical protein